MSRDGLKPITEWDGDIVKAMFAGLPEGAVILRDAYGLTVANAGSVSFSHSPRSEHWGGRDGFTYDTTLSLIALQDSKGTSVATYRFNDGIDAEGVEELKKGLNVLKAAAARVGLL